MNKLDDGVSPDLEAAAQWAETIEDSAARDRRLSGVFEKMLRADPQEGRIAVQESSLPEEMKSKLLRR